MPVYRRSEAQETIVILRAQSTTTTIAAFGSYDGFTNPGTEFAEDEEIMIAGNVVAADNADLTGINMSIILNGTPVGTTPLYGFDGSNNFYQLSLGMLAEGTYTVEAQFPRTRK